MAGLPAGVQVKPGNGMGRCAVAYPPSQDWPKSFTGQSVAQRGSWQVRATPTPQLLTSFGFVQARDSGIFPECNEVVEHAVPFEAVASLSPDMENTHVEISAGRTGEPLDPGQFL